MRFLAILEGQVFECLVFYGDQLENSKWRPYTTIYVNVNIGFRVPGVISFPKVYWFTNLHKYIERKYIVKIHRLCMVAEKSLLSSMLDSNP